MKRRLSITILFYSLLYINALFAQLPLKPALKPFVVLELFTSQGDHNSPPADKLLNRIIDEAAKNNKPVYAMEFHVDYWNKYGWKDPYSNFKYTLRQQNYINVLVEKETYTPQLMVNGHEAILGSDESAVKASMEKALKTPAAVDLEIYYKGISNDSMIISYITTKADKNYFLRIAVVEKKASNRVTAGENEGKMMEHRNVVSLFSTFDIIHTKGEVKVALKKIIPDAKYQLIAFIQHRQTMKILGATAIDF
jgi:hypothetical protein